MADSSPIGFLDSGIGGLPYLAWIRRRRPRERYAYIADNEYFPYGERPRDRLVSHLIDTVRIIVEKLAPKLLVLACNTASVAALDTLRDRFELPIVGVVPALKPAAERSKGRRIALLATSRTVAERYTDDLIERFADDCVVARIGNGNIVDFVEHQFLAASAEEKKAFLAGTVEELKQSQIDTVVIGCTHFIYIEDELRAGLGDEVAIIDSVAGVGRQIIRVLEEKNLQVSPAASPLEDTVDALYLTSKNKSAETKETFALASSRFELSFCGLLKRSNP